MTDTDALRATLLSFHDQLAGADGIPVVDPFTVSSSERRSDGEYCGHSYDRQYIEWAVTASMNLALQGLAVTPNDIDVLTDADGAYRIEELFAEHVVRPIQPPEIAANTDESIRSHYGALSLDGVEIELMGDVEHRIDGEWVPTDDIAEHREVCEVAGRDIPVMALDHELAGYRDLGRTERVAMLETHQKGGGEKGREGDA